MEYIAWLVALSGESTIVIIRLYSDTAISASLLNYIFRVKYGRTSSLTSAEMWNLKKLNIYRIESLLQIFNSATPMFSNGIWADDVALDVCGMYRLCASWRYMVNIFLWPSTSEYLPTQATAGWPVASERIIQSDGDVEKHLGRNTAAYVIVLHKYVNIRYQRKSRSSQ